MIPTESRGKGQPSCADSREKPPSFFGTPYGPTGIPHQAPLSRVWPLSRASLRIPGHETALRGTGRPDRRATQEKMRRPLQAVIIVAASVQGFLVPPPQLPLHQRPLFTSTQPCATVDPEGETFSERFEGQLPPWLLNRAEELGFLRPTQVQVEALDPILAGNDVVLQAQTGQYTPTRGSVPCLSFAPLTF